MTRIIHPQLRRLSMRVFAIVAVCLLGLGAMGMTQTVQAETDGFGDFFTASGPAALDDNTAPVAMAASDNDDTIITDDDAAAAALNAIMPAAGGNDLADDGATTPSTGLMDQGSVVPGTDILSEPGTARIPGMEANPPPADQVILP